MHALYFIIWHVLKNIRGSCCTTVGLFNSRHFTYILAVGIVYVTKRLFDFDDCELVISIHTLSSLDNNCLQTIQYYVGKQTAIIKVTDG